MKNIRKLELGKCLITDERIQSKDFKVKINYEVRLKDDKWMSFSFCKKCFNNIDFETYGTIIFGLMLNKRLDPIAQTIHWNCNLREEFDLKIFLEQESYPRTPSEKLDNLLISIKNLPKVLGQTIIMDKIFLNSYFHEKNYLIFTEFRIYLEALNKKGFIDYRTSLGKSQNFNITFEGLNKIIELETEGHTSKNCFIAMAFDNRTKGIREAIKSAIRKTGYNPIIIDEEHVNSDQTINDAMLAGIKKSKFCIADFTYHRNGVYFESGYALGMGKPVIYTCSKEEFKNAHFDIRPLQHIVYENETELERDLIHKIEAWIS